MGKRETESESSISETDEEDYWHGAFASVEICIAEMFDYVCDKVLRYQHNHFNGERVIIGCFSAETS